MECTVTYVMECDPLRQGLFVQCTEIERRAEDAVDHRAAFAEFNSQGCLDGFHAEEEVVLIGLQRGQQCLVVGRLGLLEVERDAVVLGLRR